MQKLNLFLFLFFIFIFFTNNIKEKNCLEIDVILLGDISGSVENNRELADAFESFINRFELSDNTIRIGIIKFNIEPILVVPLTSNKIKLKKAIWNIRNSKATNISIISEALYLAGIQLLSSERKVKKLIIIVSNGAAKDKIQSIEASEIIKKSDILICGIFIEDSIESNEPLMMQISSDCYARTNFEMLINKLNYLNIICL